MNQSSIDLTHFDVQRIIGVGGFGKVKAVQKLSGQDKDKWYAMKLLDKTVALKSKSGVKQIMNERNMLANLNSKWIINSRYCFHDLSFAYIVMDVCLGGDLRYRMNKSGGKLKPSDTIFYSTQIVYALNYLHKEGVLHRDIKPENVVMETDGYVKLTDFGISATTEADGSYSGGSGTAGYMAPEMYSKTRKQKTPVDWFALGVTMWEFLTGHRPFDGRKIAGGWAEGQELQESDWPKVTWKDLNVLSDDQADLLKRLLSLNVKDRLGTADDMEVLNHPAFAGHEAIDNKSNKAPFTPDITVANCDTGADDVMDQFGASKVAKISQEQNAAFDGYDYNTAYAGDAL